MTRERVTIAAFSFAIVLFVLWLDWRIGAWVGSLLLLTVICTLALAETYALLRRIGLESNAAYGVIAGAVLMLWRGIAQWERVTGLDPAEARDSVLVLLAGVVILPLVAGLFRTSPRDPGDRTELERIATTLFGLLVVWFLMSFLLEIRLLDDGSGTTRRGLELTVLLVLSVKLGGDSAAYLVGRSVGRRPLTWVSPKKTWEGAAGSLAGGVLVAVVTGLVLGLSGWKMALFGVVTNVAAQLGDLVESLLKRRAGLKDSGTLFREIGGFLDLMDSLLLAAPVGYLFIRIVGV